MSSNQVHVSSVKQSDVLKKLKDGAYDLPDGFLAVISEAMREGSEQAFWHRIDNCQYELPAHLRCEIVCAIDQGLPGSKCYYCGGVDYIIGNHCCLQLKEGDFQALEKHTGCEGEKLPEKFKAYLTKQAKIVGDQFWVKLDISQQYLNWLQNV